MSQYQASSSSHGQSKYRPRTTAPVDLLGSSPEFGDFVDSESQASNDVLLGNTMPLAHPKYTRQPITDRPLIDLMSDEPFPDHAWHPDSNEPLHIQLPPRPSEITPDYNPPIRSPRRLSELAFSGAGSPPQVSGIVFHPAPETQPSSQRNAHSGNAQSKLINTLATTTKIASKWRSAVDHGTFSQSSNLQQPPNSTALPIDVNHSTPFTSWDRCAGSYIPPSGAPGFTPETSSFQEIATHDKDFSGTSLLGRRESTEAVLTVGVADKLRQHLPSRRRISDRWTLLFSLDQHGSSLATLYRLIEKSAHRGAGNILVVRDEEGHIFGSYINEMIAKREGAYYGGGESFLFKIVGDQAKIFRWTGKNQYFALCESGFISFGGGAGTYGLLLDSSFSHNSSATCPTFDNEVLSNSGCIRKPQATAFACSGLEVWSTG